MSALKSPIPQVMSNTKASVKFSGKTQQLNGFSKTARSCSKKSPTTYYFAKCDSDERICEKIMRLNILPSQFYAALAIFSAPKRGLAQPPVPPPPPQSSIMLE